MAPGTVLAQKHIDLIDLIFLIHNGPRCELKQLNRPRSDLIEFIVVIVLIVLILLIHNGPGTVLAQKTH